MNFESRPAPQAIVEKDGWKVTFVAYSSEEVAAAALTLLYGE